MTSSPLERSVTSLAIATNATAEDSGGGVTCAKISFLGLAWAKAGALASERSPAALAACRMRRRVAEAVIVTGDLPTVVFSACRDYSSPFGLTPRNQPVIARSGATKQPRRTKYTAARDCFAALAMTIPAYKLSAGNSTQRRSRWLW